jgi:hypothetical protein
MKSRNIGALHHRELSTIHGASGMASQTVNMSKHLHPAEIVKNAGVGINKWHLKKRQILGTRISVI